MNSSLGEKGTYETLSLPDQAGYLMKLANIPEEYRQEMSGYIQKEIQQSKKSFKRLIELYGHPCTQDILGSSIRNLKIKIESVKPPILSPDMFAQHRKNLLMGIAAILGSGFTTVMKNELEYSPSGLAIGVGSSTRGRHPICDNALSGRPIPGDYTRKAGRRRRRKLRTKKRKTLRRVRH